MFLLSSRKGLFLNRISLKNLFVCSYVALVLHFDYHLCLLVGKLAEILSLLSVFEKLTSPKSLLPFGLRVSK